MLRIPGVRIRVESPARVASPALARGLWSAAWASFGLAASLIVAGCHLDAGGKMACDTAEDCLGGYVCTNHTCVAEGERGSNGALSAPTGVAGSFDPNSLEYRLSWQDNSDDETGFEIAQEYRDSRSLGDPALTNLRPMPANVRVAAYRFVREGTFTFRVRAVRGGESSSYSEPHVHTASAVELFPWDEAKVPTTPQSEYSYVESDDLFSGSVELRWSPADFRGDEDSLTGYRVYRREASFGSWTLLRSLPTSIRFYLDSRDDAGMMGYEYAIAAFNSFGESRYWTYSEDEDAL